jgi:hypothetical protein
MLVRIRPAEEFSDTGIRTWLQRYYSSDSERKLTDRQTPPVGQVGQSL